MHNSKALAQVDRRSLANPEHRFLVLTECHITKGLTLSLNGGRITAPNGRVGYEGESDRRSFAKPRMKPDSY